MEENKETISYRIDNKPRTLKAEEIECRVGTINGKGCSLLLYKDARVDMKILDEVYGVGNWQRTHEVINGNLFCTIEIWNDRICQWVKNKMQELKVIQKRKKEKHLIVLKEQDLMQVLVENYIQVLLFGLCQKQI